MKWIPIPPTPRRRSGPRALLRRALSPFWVAVPFAVFFGFLFRAGWPGYVRAYLVALVFTAVIGLVVEANQRWVTPRLRAAGRPGRRSDTLREVASYVAAAMLGAGLAGVIVNWLVLPGFLGSTHSIVAFFMFSALFCALFTGIAFAFHFHGAFIARVRSEEQYKTRVEHEIRTALAIQQALMPTSRRLPPLFDVAGAALPSRSISGDFLDYFELPGGRLAFVLGDVSGKGPASALLAAAIQGMFTSVAESEEHPADAIRRVNRALVRRAGHSKFATVFHGLLTPEGNLYACNAGHNPPLLLRGGGRSEWLQGGGLLLGIFGEAVYEDVSVRLSPGDALVLFSDGVTEAAGPDGEMFGEQRVLACLEGTGGRPAAEILDRLLARVRDFAAGEPQADDITVLVVRYAGEA